MHITLFQRIAFMNFIFIIFCKIFNKEMLLRLFDIHECVLRRMAMLFLYSYFWHSTYIYHYIEINWNIFPKIYVYYVSEYSVYFQQHTVKLWKLSWYFIFISYYATWILFHIVTEYQNPYFFEVSIMMKARKIVAFFEYVKNQCKNTGYAAYLGYLLKYFEETSTFWSLFANKIIFLLRNIFFYSMCSENIFAMQTCKLRNL